MWDGVDAALYAHPEFIDTVSLESRWMRRATATVPGARDARHADQPPLCGGARPRSRSRAGTCPTTSCSSGSSSTATSRRRRASCTKATFLLFGDEEQEVEAGLDGGPGRVPDATWEIGRLVRGGAPQRARDGRRRRGVPRARARLRRRPAAPPVRDGLREHLATVSGCADRRRPRRAAGSSTRTRVRRSSPRRTARRRRRPSRRCSRSQRSRSSIRSQLTAAKELPQSARRRGADPADGLGHLGRRAVSPSLRLVDSRASKRGRSRTAASAPRRRCR